MPLLGKLQLRAREYSAGVVTPFFFFWTVAKDSECEQGL